MYWYKHCSSKTSTSTTTHLLSNVSITNNSSTKQKEKQRTLKNADDPVGSHSFLGRNIPWNICLLLVRTSNFSHPFQIRGVDSRGSCWCELVGWDGRWRVQAGVERNVSQLRQVRWFFFFVNCTPSEGSVGCLVSAIGSLCDFAFRLNKISAPQWSLFEKMPERTAPAPGERETHAQRWPACSLGRGSQWQLLGDPPIYLLFLQPPQPPSRCPILPSTSLLLCRLAGRTRQSRTAIELHRTNAKSNLSFCKYFNECPGWSTS